MADKRQNGVAVSRESSSGLVFDTCCCCVPLKTGCLIFGYLNLVALFILAIFAMLGASASVALMNSDVDEKYRQIGRVLLIIVVVSIVLILISLPFSILLLVGLHKERRKYIKIYLIYAVIALAFSVLLEIVKYSSGHGNFKDMPEAIIKILLTVYFLLVVRSQYIKMGETAIDVPDQRYHDGHIVNAQKV